MARAPGSAHLTNDQRIDLVTADHHGADDHGPSTGHHRFGQWPRWRFG